MPSKIGRYRVERRIGAGAFATVWLADDEALESWVAIKVLADNWAHHPDVRARFEQEAQIMRRADSERLVRVFDVGELPDGRPYLVMTYADGGTLAERLEAGPLPVAEAVTIALEITRAVAVLHESGVLHRDLKPSNVLFHHGRAGKSGVANRAARNGAGGEAGSRVAGGGNGAASAGSRAADAGSGDQKAGGRGRVLVADLGLAKEIAHASGFTVVAGTPGYMAPEQLLPGGGLDVRADVHAIGAMLFQMLTGRTPGKPAVLPSKLRTGVPPRVDRVVQKALETDPAKRWPSAEALATALEEAATPAQAPIRWPVRVAGAAVAMAAVLATGSGALAQPTAEGWRRVTDATGALSVAVPVSWARQLTDGGWDPAAVGLTTGPEPGLVVSSDVSAWAVSGRTSPGVFAGIGENLTAAVPPTHDDCTRGPERRIVVDGLSGRVQRWTACAGTLTSYSEVVLTGSDGGGVYLQIRQADAVDRTDQVLRGVRLIRRSRTSSTGG